MGRVPIAHPPGRLTRASPYRANSGPRHRMLARILRTRSYDASGFFGGETCTRIEWPSRTTSQFNARRSSSVESISMSRGTFSNSCTPSASKVENKIGNAAFFEPLTLTVPFSVLPPTTAMESKFSSPSEEFQINSLPYCKFSVAGMRLACGRLWRVSFPKFAIQWNQGYNKE
jgi:hypothetical protein